jgi:hypothetical protein
MAIDLSRARAPKNKDEEKVKLNKGRHIVRCVDLRQKETRSSGLAFFCDFEVVSGPTQTGFRDSLAVFPETARGNAKLTKEEVEELELGKIQVCVAAVAGFVKEAAHQVNNEFYARATAHPRKEGVISPLAGSLFEIEAIEHNGKKGTSIYYEAYPHFGADAHAAAAVNQPAPAAAAPAVPSVSKLPAIPSIPKAAPVFPPKGWIFHPENDDYVIEVDGEGQPTGNFALVADKKKELGIAA